MGCLPHTCQPVANGFVAPPVDTTEGDITPHSECETAPETPVAFGMYHCPQPPKRFHEYACFSSCGCLHARSEHLDGRYNSRSGDTGYGASDQRSVVVSYVSVDGAAGVRAEVVVAGEINNVRRYRHDESWRETTPERCSALIACDFT